MLAAFQTLGASVGAAWDGDPDTLPAVASGCLSVPVPVSLSALVDWVCTVDRAAFPRQADPEARFGEPPVTVFQGEGFRIDVNLWVGDSCPILPGPAFIHSLFHLAHPSATVVIRTPGLPAHLPQQSYDLPGVCYPAAVNEGRDDLAQRRLQLASLLARTGEEAAIGGMLAGADPGWAYTLLSEVLPATWPAMGLGALKARLEGWFSRLDWDAGAQALAVRGSLGKAIERDTALRRATWTDPADRLVAGVLRSAPHRAAIEAVLGPSARSRIVAFVDRARHLPDPANPGVCVLGMSEGAIGVLRWMIAEDLSLEAILERLVAQHGAEAVAASRPALAQMDAEVRTMSLFSPWFRQGPSSG